MMKEFTCVIRLPNGNINNLTFRAYNIGDAICIAETAYGTGCFLGCTSTRDC